MGYNTKFEGELRFTAPMSVGALAVLDNLLGEDRRLHPEWDAPDTFYYIDLELTSDQLGLKWDGSEATYGMVDAVNTVIQEMRKVMPEFGLAGMMLAQGDEVGDVWILEFGENGFAVKRRVEIERAISEVAAKHSEQHKQAGMSFSQFAGVLAGIEDIEKLRAAAKAVVDTYWESAREDYYHAASKGSADGHMFHSLCALQAWANKQEE